MTAEPDLARSFEQAWQATAAGEPTLRLIACEDASRVEAAFDAFAASHAGVEAIRLVTPPARELRPLEPLLGWWQSQGTAASRHRQADACFTYAPWIDLFHALADGHPPRRIETPLMDDVDFERRSLHHGLARALVRGATHPRVVLVRDLENAGPSLLQVVRHFAGGRSVAPLLVVMQVATQRCLSDLRFESEWEAFLEWAASRDLLLSHGAPAPARADTPWPAVEALPHRFREGAVLLTHPELVAAMRELQDDATLDTPRAPSAVRHEVQLHAVGAMLHRNEVDDALAMLETLVHEIELDGHLGRLAWARRLLAYAYQSRQDLDSASTAAREALVIAEREGDPLSIARSAFALCWVHDRSTIPVPIEQFHALLPRLQAQGLWNFLLYAQRNYYLYLRFEPRLTVAEVLRENRTAARLAHRRGHLTALAATFQNRGTVLGYQGAYRAMFRCLRISEALRTQLAEPLDLVRIRNGIGYFHSLLEDYPAALASYLRAFELVRRQHDHSEILVSLFNIAQVWLLTRHWRRGIEVADRVLAICRARRITHFPFRNLFDVYTLKGFCHLHCGEPSQARQCLERMRELRFQPSPTGEYLRMLLRGRLALEEGDLARARDELESAPAWLGDDSAIDARLLPQGYLDLARLHCREGDPEGAIASLCQARDRCDEATMPVTHARIDAFLAEIQATGDCAFDDPPVPLPEVDLSLHDLVALAQQQTRLDDARRRLREVDLLSRLQRSVDIAPDVPALARLALRFVASSLSAHAAALFRRMDDDSGSAHPGLAGAVTDASGRTWIALARAGDEGAAEGLPRHLSRLQPGGGVYVENRLHREGEVGTRATYASLVALPLQEEGRLAGALVLSTHESTRYFDRHDRDVLGLLASQLSGQFAALAHRERLVRISTTDALTGLANRQALQARLRELLARGSAVALAFVDLDHFKSINDTCGHAAGDAVLREFASMLRQALRDRDVAARWGGDEFVVLFPDTSAPRARVVAERLLAALAASGHFGPLLESFTGEAVAWPGGIRPGCSIGLADLPAVDLLEPAAAACGDEDELLRRADDALYAAKREGRGCVMVWKGNGEPSGPLSGTVPAQVGASVPDMPGGSPDVRTAPADDPGDPARQSPVRGDGAAPGDPPPR